MSHDLFAVLAGVLFGLANVIPGVSGGTIAVVFGVYERLIGILADIRHMWRKELRFLITFGLGAGVGILAFGKLMNWALTRYPSLANCFFIGVILGSLPMIARKALFQGKTLTLRASNLLPSLLTLGLMIAMAVANPGDGTSAEMSGSYVSRCVRLLVWGAVSMSCMIIPGISGSFVMVLLGAYGVVIGAVAQLTSAPLGALPVLIPFGVGCLIGLFGCAKLIRWLLARHEMLTYSAILGFVIGSVFSIFPGWGEFFRVGSIVAFVIGAACIALCNHYSAD